MWDRLRSFVVALFGRTRFEQSMSDEVRFHLEARADDLVAAGATREDAWRQARSEFGAIDGVKEEARQARGLRVFDETRQDLHYGVRLLRRNPGFALVATAVLSLGLGIGTAAFSLINAVLLRPIHVEHPETLRFVYPTTRGTVSPQALPHDQFADLQRQHEIFAELAGHSRDFARVRTTAGDVTFDGESVTTDYFAVLGVRAAIGRTFAAGDDNVAATPTVVISDSLWRRRFEASSNIIGTLIQLAPAAMGPTTEPGRVYSVIGVAPPEFTGLLNPWEPTDYWVPLEIRRLDYLCIFPDQADRIAPFGRLRAGVSDAAARAFAAQVARNHRVANSGDWSATVIDAKPLQLPFTPTVVPGRLATALLFVCALVLAIAIANLAGVLLARGLARRGEIGVRLTLGAGPWRVARQLFVETAIIVAAGTFGGLGLARVLLTSVVVKIPPSAWNAFPGQHISLHAPLDVRVWLFVSGISFVTMCLIAVGPVRQALRTDLLSAITAGGGLATTARDTVRSWIVVTQFAAALILVVAAGIVTRQLVQSEATDLGFNAEAVSFVEAAPPSPTHCRRTNASAAAWRREQATFVNAMIRRTAAEPGIVSAAFTESLPWDNGRSFVVSRSDGAATSKTFWVATNTVSDDYFKTMSIPVLAGRSFDARDTSDSLPVAVICERLAQWLFAKRNPIGQQVAFQTPGQTQPLKWMEVIGVVGEIKPPYSEGEPNPMIYTTYLQRAAGHSYIVARSQLASGLVVSSLSRLVPTVDSNAIVTRAGAINDGIDQIRFPRRAAATMLSMCGVAGLGLACLGLYGVVSYSVARRMREVGIRATLGASRSDLMALVLLEGGRVAALGAAIGSIGALVAVRLTARFVVTVPSVDGPTCVFVAGLLAAVVLLACYFPARRAARVDPIVVLRSL